MTIERSKYEELGGSSRMPKIKEWVKNYFQNKEIYQNINVEVIQ